MSELFSAFSAFLLNILEYLHTYTGSYGWDIIILTIMVRLVMFPLTLSSLRGMKGMQAAQPRIKEIQELYKDDKERLTRETMALYKEIGFNPMSSCLPMLLQMPVFIVLYRVLSQPELNGYILVNESFYGMNLTSAAFTKLSPDFLKDIALVLPGMINLDILGISFFHGAYLYTPVLIVVALMTVTTIMQQKMMTVDPQQQSTMWMMNLFIVYISFVMPAGVLLYWGVSNVLQFAQQAMMKGPKIAPSKLKSGKKTEVPSKSGSKKQSGSENVIEKAKREAVEKGVASGDGDDASTGKGGSIKRNYPAQKGKNSPSSSKKKKKKKKK